MRLRRLGIDTYREPVVFLRAESPVCRSEGFDARSRVAVHAGERSLVATLHIVHGPLLAEGDAGLSEAAWHALRAVEGEEARVAHPPPLLSMSAVRAKVYGRHLEPAELRAIVEDAAANRFTEVELAAFVAGCGGDRLAYDEVVALTRAMIDIGERIEWPQRPIVDKHCVGGLPGNRTTPIVVPIVAAAGLRMPKTSSRAITSPAGTADVMATLAPVALDLAALRRVVEREGGCIAWGGAVHLSPADDAIVRIERALDIDTEGQLVASVLSKKAAAGATHVVIDVPYGPATKARDAETVERLRRSMTEVGRALGLEVRVLVTDGTQPVGRGMGPALEAHDVLAVLRGDAGAPADLRARSLSIAAELLEMGGAAAPGAGAVAAEELLRTGRAWRKFQAICEAQGGMREPPTAPHRSTVAASCAGVVREIDCRRIARVAKLAGAPTAPAAGLVLHARVGDRVTPEQPLVTVHAETPGELAYALEFLLRQDGLICIEEAP